jgi:signal transduction histidine kinase
VSERPAPGLSGREREAAANPGLSGPRRPWRRFRDLPIWSKLGMIMIVPTLATIVVGTNGLITQVDTASNADRARVLAIVSGHAGELMHQLQDERAAAVVLLASDRGNEEQVAERTTTYTDVQTGVDEAERQFQNQSAALTDLPDSYRDLLGTIRGQISVLPQTRNRVVNGGLGIIDTTATYTELVGNLVNLRELSAQLAGDIELTDRMQAVAALSRAKEFLSQERVVGHEVLYRNAYHPHLRNAFIGAQTGHDQALQAFSVVASGEEQASLDGALEGADVRQSRLYQDHLDSLDSGSLSSLPWDAAAWDAAMSTHANLMWDVERTLDGVVVDDATALRAAAERRVLVESGALLAMLLLAVLLAWLVARSMARSLRDLRQGALSVAQYGLPQAVARLRDPALSTQLSPAEVASQIAEPLPVHSKDEFGQVAVAFNAVHLEAVRTAAEQAQLRSSVATMFVNLARRSQILVDRLISQLDRLERGEEDPDRLAELFQLDHLATRMRRNDENLLVLAGADSTRVQREPASLMDVLRAAQSEVEHYTRIEFGVVDRDLEVAAHAVNDLVHLIAELFDNATAFSSPESQVVVEARRVGDRAVLYVEDRGLGLSAQQLGEINERLAKPPLVDVAVSRMMGLVVVARLAARHGVKVELRPAPERGTVADVTLPASVLVPRALGGRPGGPPAPVRPERISEQLALESGPSVSGRSPFTQPPFSPMPLPQAPAGRDQPRWDSPPPPAPAMPPPLPPPPAPPPVRQPGRSMPAWSDLTGATAAGGHNGAERTPPPGRPSSNSDATPLPRRQPGSAGEAAELPPPSPGDSPLIPRPRPGGPSGADQSPPLTGQPAAPPPWPPVQPATTTPVPAETPATPLTPQPRPDVTPSQPPTPSTPPVPAMAAAAEAAARMPHTDETMELPIFREVESVWFRTRRGEADGTERQPAPVGVPAASAAAETTEFARIPATSPDQTARADAADPAARGSQPQADVTAGTTAGNVAATSGDAMRGDTPGAGSRPPAGPGAIPGDDSWRTAADDGWRAATQAAERAVQERTPAGLPKRRPMAQLVPGGVDTGPASAQRRSPEAVRGLLSAYHRGVQRGRDQTIDDQPSDSGGSPPT